MAPKIESRYELRHFTWLSPALFLDSASDQDVRGDAPFSSVECSKYGLVVDQEMDLLGVKLELTRGEAQKL